LTERVEDWPAERLWDELERRFAPLADRPVVRGPALEISIAPLRSYVCETMRHGRLFLAGDAAHIVPPTGAKGLNLAASDVAYLAEALIAHFRRGDDAGLDGYEARALARVWKAERFSWYLTKLMHRFPEDGAFEHRMQRAELDYIAGSTAMQTAIAENYVGLPL
jgi:p-hydroxybenzoate 3-monooxygenase